MPIREDVVVGEGTKIWHPELVNLYGCKIGKDSVIGCFVEIGPGVIIGDRCRIQSMVYIPSGIIIGNNVFIGPGTIFLNDKYPPSLKLSKPPSTIVHDDVVIGGGVLILPGLTLGVGCMIGAGAVVTKDVSPFKTVVGVPARGIAWNKIITTCYDTQE